MGGKGSGRLEKDINTRQVQQTLNEAAVHAVKLVRDAVRGRDDKGHKVKALSGTKVKLCELAINHAIGSPRQKIELRHSGVLTLRDLAEMAYAGEPREMALDKDETLRPVVEGEGETITGSIVQPDSV